jgi:DNA-binding transcriptional ArsR family regulator
MRTVKTLAALGDLRALVVVAALVDAPLDQAAIRALIGEVTGRPLGQSAASELMSRLVESGLVDKPKQVGPYELTAVEEVRTLLAAATAVADVLDARAQRVENFIRAKAGVSAPGAEIHLVPPASDADAS